MRTAAEILNRSLVLLGEEKGEDTEAFERRAVSLINVLLAGVEEGEPDSSESPVRQIRSLEDEVGDDGLCFALLPLGLAALLIEEEDSHRASFFLGLYQDERERYRQRSRKGRRHKIKRSF